MIVIIISLLEIIESVTGTRWTDSLLFLPLLLFLTVTLQLSVQSIQSLNIGQVSDTFILPAGKNPVRIAEIGFPGGCYCTGTGLREDVHSESVIFHPVVDHVDLRLDRITVADSECF